MPMSLRQPVRKALVREATADGGFQDVQEAVRILLLALVVAKRRSST
jgi:hypothetical protein